MPVYVDQLFDTEGMSDRWPFKQACHMMADTDAELHAFAAQLGLRRAWHQPCPPHSVSHYDLTPNKRRRAIQLGAHRRVDVLLLLRQIAGGSRDAQTKSDVMVAVPTVVSRTQQDGAQDRVAVAAPRGLLGVHPVGDTGRGRAGSECRGSAARTRQHVGTIVNRAELPADIKCPYVRRDCAYPACMDTAAGTQDRACLNLNTEDRRSKRAIATASDPKPEPHHLRVVPHKPKSDVPAWKEPKDAIIEFAKEVTEGKIKPVKVFILFFEEDEKTSRLLPRRWHSSVTTSEAIALCEVGKQLEMEDWRE